MRKILLFLAFLFMNIGYSDTTSNMFQNSSILNFANTNPSPSYTNNISDTSTMTNSKGQEFLNKTVALVNDKPITYLMLEQQVAKLKATLPQATNMSLLTIKRQALQELISQSALYQLAQQYRITVSNSELDTAIKNIAAKNNISVKSLKLNIESSGMSFDNYKNTVRKELVISKLQRQAVSQQINISPEEIEKYITNHQNEFDKQINPTKKYLLRNLVVNLPKSKKSKDKEINFLKKIAIATNKGYMDFKDAVEKYSQASNASSGGMLVNHPVELSFIPSIYRDKVKNLKQGQVSEPFIVDDSIQMIYVSKIEQDSPLLDKNTTKYHAYGIVIKLNGSLAGQDAKAILKRAETSIKSGKKFNEVAKKFNQDYNYPDGDFGWVSDMDNPQPLSPAAFTELQKLKENQLSEPFELNPNAWMIIKYTKTKQFNISKQLEKQKALEAIFAKKAQQVYKTWLISIKDSSYIKILDKNLKTPELY